VIDKAFKPIAEPSALAFSLAEVVQISGLGRTLLFGEIRDGRLVARKCGRRTVVLKDDLLVWLRAMPPSHNALPNRAVEQERL
jgi:hypothetical protein